ncbi:MAG: hypothetical protein RIB47_13360 [Cyclobacteriaceae bacterium]
MQLIKASNSILSQLALVVEQIDEQDFIKPCGQLGNVSIGQHMRHTLEFFICLQSGCQRGVINYDARAHDQTLEASKDLALQTIRSISEFVGAQKSDFGLRLEVGYKLDSHECVILDTNYFRELTYNIEHAVHHMAIMKIGLREIAPYIVLPPDFGIAASTLRHKDVAVTAQ